MKRPTRTSRKELEAIVNKKPWDCSKKPWCKSFVDAMEKKKGSGCIDVKVWAKDIIDRFSKLPTVTIQGFSPVPGTLVYLNGNPIGVVANNK